MTQSNKKYYVINFFGLIDNLSFVFAYSDRGQFPRNPSHQYSGQCG